MTYNILKGKSSSTVGGYCDQGCNMLVGRRGGGGEEGEGDILECRQESNPLYMYW